MKGNGTAFLFAPHIHLIDPDGQNRRRLKNADGLNPVWSPDGKRLLFTRLEREGEGTSLWSVGVDGANPRQLVKQEGKGDTIMGADWSPDGKSLAYAFSEGQRFDQEGKGPGLFVARADGSQPRRVAGGPKEIVFGVKWAADGKRLFFTRRDRSGPLLEKNQKNPAGGRDWGPCAVYAIDVDGRNLRHVTMGNQREYVGGNFLFAMKMLVR